eukprot:TRINITY_DN18130_c0_g1_i1.p1 TRINITY_DN18130_c0_g1~~TRINITY_DN18130_c0_g1_i1.p1  ORF type:complete len:175 (+),score=16.81 TRINITY_DN18130_c0_g1_i1:42-566(+)
MGHNILFVVMIRGPPKSTLSSSSAASDVYKRQEYMGGQIMKLTFIGADHEVTGSCHYLEACGKHILVDYGMEQGLNVFENAELPIEEAQIDYVLLTHAHIDHSGMLPLLYAKGFRGQIFTTYATADLCSIMLRDCAHIQMQEAEWKNRKAKRSSGVESIEPLYHGRCRWNNQKN